MKTNLKQNQREIMQLPIKRALISVSDKTGLEELVACLKERNVEILSTGGTAEKVRQLGGNVVDIADYTGFPEMMEGRVKTLHPKVHGGLLGVRDNKQHSSAMEEHDIQPIDLVVVNLYPFEETVAKGSDAETTIENIDIGGPSMVRSAAKNHHYTTIVVDPSDYEGLIEEINETEGTSLEFRQRMAAKAFARTSAYDAAISSWFAGHVGEDFPSTLSLPGDLHTTLRYGENPHQKAALYVQKGQTCIGSAQQVQGKELSYNNIHDADAALAIVAELEKPSVAIIKHANPCGVAFAETITEAYDKALASDPVSAFGGIIALNKTLDEATAKKISEIFVEVVIAPDAEDAALSCLSKKKNLRVLLVGELLHQKSKNNIVKTIAGGFLVQEQDSVSIDRSALQSVTKVAPVGQQLDDLMFAFIVCKHVKSNAIVLVKDGATVGIGAGQMSRVDSSKVAVMKAKENEQGVNRAEGAVLASDAFFPFADGVLQAAEAGVKAIVQPGGSVRDAEVIQAADEHGIAMVFTGVRHFKH